MLVDALANPLPDGATESTVPRAVLRARRAAARAYGANLAERPPGDSGLGARPRARPRGPADRRRRARRVAERRRPRSTRSRTPRRPRTTCAAASTTREDGSYAFLAVRPVPYTIPERRAGRRDARSNGAAPLAPGAYPRDRARARATGRLRRTSSTPTSDYLDSDAVFAVKPSLLRNFVPHRRRTTRSGRTASTGDGSRSRATSCSSRAARGRRAERSGPHGVTTARAASRTSGARTARR